MARPPALPEPFRRRPFAVADALRAGVTRDRLRRRDLQKPYFGVRSSGLDLESVAGRCHAYAARMHPDHAFGYLTAAALYRFPLPWRLGDGSLRDDDRLHVVARSPGRAPEGRGVVGHQARLAADDVRTVDGLHVVSPAVAWCQMTELLDVADAVAVADWIVTGNPYNGVLPLATVEELAAASAARTSGRGHRVRQEALPLVRRGPLSRPESLLRLLLVRAGLPEPRLNEPCYDENGEFIAMPDVSWLEYKAAGEYEGDHHRDVTQFRYDIGRIERLADHDWSTTKCSADDLFDDPVGLARRFARRLVARGWRGTVDLRHLGRFRR
jgi:hypothetical protein